MTAILKITSLNVLQGESCSACDSVGQLPANLNSGALTQMLLQKKGEKGEPGIGQKGEQVSFFFSSTVDILYNIAHKEERTEIVYLK